MKKGKQLFLSFGAIFALASCGGAPSSSTSKSDSSSSSQESSQHTHSLGEWVVTESEHYHQCSDCGETVDRGTHRGGTATCQQKAVCSVCGHEYGSLEDHQYSAWAVAEDEAKHTRACSVCNDVQIEEHTWDDGVVSKPATHTQEGETVYTCTKCSATKKESIAVIATHVYDQCVEDEQYLLFEGSCTEGSTYFMSCSCGKSSDDPTLTFVSTNFGHNYCENVSEKVDDKGKPVNLLSEADCEHASEYYKVCSVCGEMSPETFEVGEALGHDLQQFEASDPSFASGCTEHTECSRCGKCFEGETEIDPSTVSFCQKDDPTFVCSEENPYIIKTEKDLRALHDLVNTSKEDDLHTYEGMFFKMTADIVLTQEWATPIGLNGNVNAFKGTFDGDGHTISDLTISREAGCTALFGNAVGATIKNLKVDNVDLESTSEVAATAQRTAAIIGRADNCVIENVHVLGGSINGSKENGGLVGVVVNGITIKNCSNAATVEAAASAVGGLIGNAYSGDVTILNSVNKGAVQTVDNNVGGLIGYVNSTGTITITDSTNEGVLTGKSGTGGLIGNLANASTVRITTCENKGEIKGSGEGVGGLVGWQSKAYSALYIHASINRGDVSRQIAANGIGGILGLNVDNGYFEIDESDNYGTITAPNGTNGVGGFVGLIRLSRVPNSGATSASACNKLINCTNYGNIVGKEDGFTGPLAGRNRGTIQGCRVLATATVNGVAVSELEGVKQFVGTNESGGTTTDCSILTLEA